MERVFFTKTGINVATILHHCVMECWLNQPFNPSFDGKELMGIENTRWFSSRCNIPNIGYWLNVIHVGVLG